LTQQVLDHLLFRAFQSTPCGLGVPSAVKMSGDSMDRKLPTGPKRYFITPGTDFNDEEYDLTPGNLTERVDKSIQIFQIHPSLAPHRLRQH
jgi:hypothetical protein